MGPRTTPRDEPLSESQGTRTIVTFRLAGEEHGVPVERVLEVLDRGIEALGAWLDRRPG